MSNTDIKKNFTRKGKKGLPVMLKWNFLHAVYNLFLTKIHVNLPTYLAAWDEKKTKPGFQN